MVNEFKRFWTGVLLPGLMILMVVGFLIAGVLNQIEVIVDDEISEVERLIKEQKQTKNIFNINGKDVNYMYGEATAYTPSAGGINSNNTPELTSTMKPAKNGVIAVNPEVIPYGSQVMIIFENTVIRGQALDTGGAMRQNGKQVDILMENHKKALEWGRKDVHIIWWSE